MIAGVATGAARFVQKAVSVSVQSVPRVVSFNVLHSGVSGNDVVWQGGNPRASSGTLVGSGVGREAQNALEDCPFTSGILFLFSGGDSRLPLSIAGDAVLTCLRLELDDGALYPDDVVVDRAGYSFQCAGNATTGTCPPDEFLQDSTKTESWKEVNRFYCEEVHDIFAVPSQRIPQCHVHQCDGATVCHSPGEQFHALVPQGQQGNQWLLVTRQTWPAGSPGNSSTTDLFRVLPFETEQQANLTLLDTGGGGSAYTPAGLVYSGTRVVPEEGGADAGSGG